MSSTATLKHFFPSRRSNISHNILLLIAWKQHLKACPPSIRFFSWVLEGQQMKSNLLMNLNPNKLTGTNIAPTSAILSLVGKLPKSSMQSNFYLHRKKVLPLTCDAFFVLPACAEPFSYERLCSTRTTSITRTYRNGTLSQYEQCTFCIFLLHEPDVPLLVPDVP